MKKLLLIVVVFMGSCNDTPDRTAKTSGDNFFVTKDGDTVPVIQGHIEVPTTFRRRTYEDSMTGFKVTYVGTANCCCSCACNKP